VRHADERREKLEELEALRREQPDVSPGSPELGSYAHHKACGKLPRRIPKGEPQSAASLQLGCSESGENLSRPAHSFLDGLQSIADEVKENDGKLSPAYFPLLDKFDPALIDFCNKAIARSKKFAEDFLSKYMLKDQPERAADIAEKLNSAERYLSHGAVIDADAARELGLDVEYLGSQDDLWRAYWRVYCEMRIALQMPNWRLVEGRRAAMIY
jgi:hypothetical protein